MDRSAVLPPVGFIGRDDHSLVTTYLSNLAQEAIGGADDWIKAAESNLTIYTYGGDPQPSTCSVTSNLIQDAVNAVVDFQTKDPPIRKLDPVERGEPGEVWYFQNQPSQTDPATGQQTKTPPQVIGPMTPEQAQAMQQAQIQVGTDAMGQPVTQRAYNPDNFVTIDDKATADFFQGQLDVWAARGQIDKSIRKVVHSGNIFGFLFPVYEWDKDYHRPRLWTDISLKDTYVDATREAIEDMAYVGVDWWIDAQQAIAMFPHLADIIEEHAHTGTPDRPGMETQLGFNIENANKSGGFKRNTIILRVFWLRNQPCPFEEEQAIAQGLLERRMIPLGDPGAVIPDEADVFPKGHESSETQQQEQDEQQPQSGTVPQGAGDAATGGGSDLAVGGATAGAGDVQGSGAGGPIAPAPQQYRTGLFHAATGVEVKPPSGEDLDPNWPMYRCIRQITTVLNLVVDDRECEYWDIPVLQMISTPIPYQPFGQGLPARLASMQDARNRMLNGIADHVDLNMHPVMKTTQSVWDALPNTYKEKGALRAGMTAVLPDEIARANPNAVDFIKPPEMTPALVDSQNIFHGELTERAGNPQVLQGQNPQGVTGWQSIQILSQNASSRFGFSMQMTKDMIWRLFMLILHDLANPEKVTPQDLAAIDSRYPLPIIEAFQRRGAMMDWDINVDIQSGVGSSKNRKVAEAMQLHSTVDPITGDPVLSTETLTDVTGNDFQKEQRRNAAARQQAMQQQAMAAAMMPQPQPPPVTDRKDQPQHPDHPSGNGRFSGNGDLNHG